MKKLLLIALIICIIACKTDGVKLIWDSAGKPINITTPEGFNISPEYAYSQVWDQHLLSLKHIWHIYADAENYYIIDSFLGSNSRKALKTGIVIDGKTGLRKNR